MLELLEQIVRRAESGESARVVHGCPQRGSTPQEKGPPCSCWPMGKPWARWAGVASRPRWPHALALIEEHRSRLLTFRLDQDYGWDDGLVCGGIMDGRCR